MATNRIEILKQMLAQDPGNSFARYGLAMEHSKSGEFEAAIAEFKKLIASDASYVAAYYHCGQALERTGELGEAKAVYERGIVASAAKGDSHTRAEIETALAALPV